MTATSGSFPSGKKQLTAVVDPANKVAESDEGNNRAPSTVSG